MEERVKQILLFRSGFCMMREEYLSAPVQRLSLETISYFERSSHQIHSADPAVESDSDLICRCAHINLSIIYFAIGEYRKCLDHAILAGDQEKILMFEKGSMDTYLLSRWIYGTNAAETVAGTICYRKAEQLMLSHLPDQSAKTVLQNIIQTFPSLRLNHQTRHIKLLKQNKSFEYECFVFICF